MQNSGCFCYLPSDDINNSENCVALSIRMKCTYVITINLRHFGILSFKKISSETRSQLTSSQPSSMAIGQYLNYKLYNFRNQSSSLISQYHYVARYSLNSLM